VKSASVQLEITDHRPGVFIVMMEAPMLATAVIAACLSVFIGWWRHLRTNRKYFRRRSIRLDFDGL